MMKIVITVLNVLSPVKDLPRASFGRSSRAFSIESQPYDKEMNFSACSRNKRFGGLGQKGLGSMIEEKGTSLSNKLEALIDHYGIRELLRSLFSICWGRAAEAVEEGQDPSQWSELAVKLGTAIEV